MNEIRWHRGTGPGDKNPEPGKWYAEVAGTVVCTGSRSDHGTYAGQAAGIRCWGATFADFKASAANRIRPGASRPVRRIK